MASPAVVPNPIARMLLSLADRAATGVIDIGGRRLSILEGQIADVAGTESDGSLISFLVRAGRLTASQADGAVSESQRSGLTLSQWLTKSKKIREDQLRESRRALWLERLVHGLETAEQGTTEPFVPQSVSMPEYPLEDLVPLVLSALTRRAARGDAELVGQRADHHLVWEDSTHSKLAKKWSEFDSNATTMPLAKLLPKVPAGASRVAALMRAGLVRLTTSSTVHANEEEARETSEHQPRVNLAPGEAFETRGHHLDIQLRQLPPATAPLADPLAPLERRIKTLEEHGRFGSDLSNAWRDLSVVWATRYDAPFEATRALREAASADRNNGLILREAAKAASALGQLDVARAYAALPAFKLPRKSYLELVPQVVNWAVRAADLEWLNTIVADSVELIDETSDRSELYELFARAFLNLSAGSLAAHYARRAAASAQSLDRRRSLLAEAVLAAPDDDALREYAQVLYEQGFIAGAAALLREGADEASDADTRRIRSLEAAQLAEAGSRPDLASEILRGAFDAEPHLDVLYEPLSSDFEDAGNPVAHALMLEEIAAECSSDQRGYWLTRAADAHLTRGQDPRWAIELFVRALCSDPGAPRPREALQEHAQKQRDPLVLADAFERVIRLNLETIPEAVEPLLVELSWVAEHELRSTHRALWAWERLAQMDPSDTKRKDQVARLRRRVKVKDGLIELAHEDLRQALEADRPEHVRRLASMLRDDPNRRGQAIALYRETLAYDPDDVTAASSLEHLLRVAADERGLAVHLKQNGESSSERLTERVRQLSWLLGMAGLIRDDALTLHVGQLLLSLDSRHEEAILRMSRVAERLGDIEAGRKALELSVQTAANPREKARALCRLSRMEHRSGSIEASMRRAVAAVQADPTSADALPVLLKHIGRTRPKRALRILKAARNVVGDSAPLIRVSIEAATADRDLQTRGALIDRWLDLTPLDPNAQKAHLELQTEHGEIDALHATIKAALACPSLTPVEDTALLAAIAALGALGDVSNASALAIEAADRCCPNAIDLAERLADQAGDRNARRAAFERRIAWSTERNRPKLLQELAVFYRSNGDPAAEVRSLLRALACTPRDRETLARLTELYASAGEGERLMAVLALRQSLMETEEEQEDILLLMADAAAHHLADVDRAASYIHELVELGPTTRQAQRAAGALIALDRGEEAIATLLHRAVSIDTSEREELCLQAVAIAEADLADPVLALNTAIEGLTYASHSGRLLLDFERLALSTDNVALALETYEQLLEQAAGTHGRRALLYRQARWLERANHLRPALASFKASFETDPSSGAVLHGLERLAKQLGDWEALLSAYTRLAKSTNQVDLRLQRVYKAADIADTALEQPDRAFGLLNEAWRTTGKNEVVGHLRKTALRICERNPDTGIDALNQIVTRLEHEAEANWHADYKLSCLSQVAAIQAEDLGDFEQASKTIEQATEVEGASNLALAELKVQLSGWLHQVRFYDASIAALVDALHRAPEHEHAPQWGERLERLQQERQPLAGAPHDAWNTAKPGAATSDSLDSSQPEPSRAEQPHAVRQEPFQTSKSDAPPLLGQEGEALSQVEESPSGHGKTEMEALYAQGTDPAHVETTKTRRQWWSPSSMPPKKADHSSQNPAPTTQRLASIPLVRGTPSELEKRAVEEPLREASRAGDLDASIQLAMQLWSRPSDRPEAVEMVRQVVRADPSRCSAAKMLYQSAKEMRIEPLAQVTASLISVFDTRIATPSASGSLAKHLESPLKLAIGRPSPLFDALALVWRHAHALFRRSLPECGLSEEERMTEEGDQELSSAYAMAVRHFDLGDIGFFTPKSEQAAFQVLPTYPASLAADPQLSTQGSEIQLRFRITRALMCARPEFVLLHAYAPHRSRVILDSLKVAFGPHDAAPFPESQASTDLIGELWQTIPPTVQNDLRALLGEPEWTLDYLKLRMESEKIASRAGFICCGDVQQSLLALGQDATELSGIDIRTDDGFVEACHRSPSMRSVISLALSDECLEAKELLERGR